MHRCAVKIICPVASQMECAIRAIDIPQAFSQSSNLHPKGRAIVIPATMIHLQWAGKLHPTNHDCSKLSRHRGFLLLRPLYGGRDAPMRWFLALPKRLREHGFAQMKSDVCIFAKRDKGGNLTGCLVAHVGDLLFCGTPGFRKEAITAIQTFRAGGSKRYLANRRLRLLD